MLAGFQTALKLAYPPRCVGCGALVESDFGLCGACWQDTPFIGGLVCDLCGVPLPGGDPGEVAHCDSCLSVERPWIRGRAAFLYEGMGRKLVLALKHGDRTDIVRPAAQWLRAAAAPILDKSAIVAPVPLHRWRFLSRRFNQASLLADAFAHQTGLPSCPDLLLRPRAQGNTEGLGHEDRFRLLDGAIVANPKQAPQMQGRPVLLVDDVMTSGATLSAAAQACHAAGSGPVCVLVLARVALDT